MLLPDASQAEVYEAAAQDIVQKVIGGFNGTIMAYGQVSPSPGLGSKQLSEKYTATSVLCYARFLA